MRRFRCSRRSPPASRSSAAAIGGIPELIDEGRSGWLFPAGDVAALAAVLREVGDTSDAHPGGDGAGSAGEGGAGLFPREGYVDRDAGALRPPPPPPPPFARRPGAPAGRTVCAVFDRTSARQAFAFEAGRLVFELDVLFLPIDPRAILHSFRDARGVREFLSQPGSPTGRFPSSTIGSS